MEVRMTTREDTFLAIESILDQLDYGVIADSDDLIGIGECLNLLEQLEKLESSPSEEWTENLEGVKALFDHLIVQDFLDSEGTWKVIRQLIGKFSAGDKGAHSTVPLEKPLTKIAEHGEEDDLAIGDDLAEELLPSDNGEALKFEDRSQPGVQLPAVENGVSSSLDSPKTEDEGARGGPSHEGEEQESEEEPGPISSKVTDAGVIEIYDMELIKDFIAEAREHLASIELNLLSLEADPEDREVIDAIFRPFHSIKGVAGFLNLSDIHHLSHDVENLLDAARTGELSVTNLLIDLILDAVDLLKMLLDDLEKSSGRQEPIQPRSQLVQAFLNRLRDLQGQETLPPRAPIRKVGDILVEHGVVEPEKIEEIAKSCQSRGTKLGEELIGEGLATPRDIWRALREQRSRKESVAFVRVDTLKLDNLVDTIGELVIAQSMVLQNGEVLGIRDQKLQKDTVQLRRITAELQRVSMSMRMVPIKSTFQKMIRLVRDLSKKSGKEVILEMHGEETEVDRNMVEEIYEPLVHLIRNSIDHGIELPDERKQLGKAPQGSIQLVAGQRGGHIIIDVYDDGRGLDAERIRARAIEKGILSPEEPLEAQSTYELIFDAGFSTKERVTEVSGRGVGMDVVKKSVEQLRGNVEISSFPGKGTHFRLKLPLTMAIIDGMVICVGQERYVVPTIAMKEFLRPSKETYLTVHTQGEMIKVRDVLMPLIRLHEIFGVEPRYHNPWEALVLVVNEDNRFYCLLADEILGRQEVVIKSLGASMRNLKGISGGAILGDGRVVLILDVKSVINLFEESKI
jgi:two-component system chemotaxis sensor kinase CheA